MNTRVLLLACFAFLPLLVRPQDAPQGAPQGAQQDVQQEKRGSTTRQAPAKPVLRIASFNVENLFDNYDNPYRKDEGTSPKSTFQILKLARTMDALDADILAVQEVENRGILERLNRVLQRPFPYVELIEGNDFRGIDVALLSRFPIQRSMSHRFRKLGGKHRIARDLVVFELDTGPGGKLLVSPVHLKSHYSSKGDPESKLWRAAEAKGLLDLLDELRAKTWKAPFITLGDFNDKPDAAALAPLFARLQDGLKGIPAADNYSYIFRGEKQRIDHLLFDGDLQVVGAHFLHGKDQASDHDPFVVSFAWKAPLDRKAGPKPRDRDQERIKQVHRPRVEATDLRRLRLLMLQEIAVEGKLVRIDKTRSGGHKLLRFSEKPKSSITVFLGGRDAARFPDIDKLIGKSLLIKGPLFRYRGQLEIKLHDPAQLEEL